MIFSIKELQWQVGLKTYRVIHLIYLTAISKAFSKDFFKNPLNKFEFLCQLSGVFDVLFLQTSVYYLHQDCSNSVHERAEFLYSWAEANAGRSCWVLGSHLQMFVLVHFNGCIGLNFFVFFFFLSHRSVWIFLNVLVEEERVSVSISCLNCYGSIFFLFENCICCPVVADVALEMGLLQISAVFHGFSNMSLLLPQCGFFFFLCNANM